MNAASDRSRTERDAIARSLVSEIWLLVDFVAGSSRDRLSKVVVATRDGSAGLMTPREMLDNVSTIEDALDQGSALPAADRTYLQTLRDALNSEIEPASGLTVAYSSLVAGPYRNEKASRVTMAENAYEKLGDTARVHRLWISLIFALGMMLTLIAVWESSKVALGRALLENMSLLRTQQATLAADKFRAEAAQAGNTDLGRALDETGDAPPIPVMSYRLCDRAIVRFAREERHSLAVATAMRDGGTIKTVMSYANPEERDLCGRDDVLRVNIGVLHDDLLVYSTDWPSMIGGVFTAPHNFLCTIGSCGKPDAREAHDLEFEVAPALLVWGNLILPIIFGLIGSCISVLLDFYNKLKCSQLHPNDRFLTGVRLGMGAIVGACVGLFYSGTNLSAPAMAPIPGAILLSSLTLTASGVAFLAGFGVEAVFGMLQSLLSRVFPTRPEPVK